MTQNELDSSQNTSKFLIFKEENDKPKLLPPK